MDDALDDFFDVDVLIQFEYFVSKKKANLQSLYCSLVTLFGLVR